MITSLAIFAIASVVIMYACNSFDDASSHLGRNMPAGVKGATINAIASSMPELLTVTFLLFLYHDHDGFSAGIATCAGSAVFNAVIIPGLSILAVLFFGVTTKGITQRIKSITVSKKTIIRDGFFFLLAEIMLIYFLKDTEMVWWMGGALVGIYIIYFTYMMYQFKTHETTEEEEDEEEQEQIPFLTALRTLDFNQLFFAGKSFTTASAWTVLVLATSCIGGACYFLADATMSLAKALSVPPFVTAVIFTAAATSVPDTVISVKDALKGNYDDAISNAIGSNIFDITICLGLPLFVYGLIHGDVTLSATSGAADVQMLRIGLIAVTLLVLGILLIGKKLGRVKAIILFGIYIVWLAAILFNLM